jgi:hypothetical protein
MVGIMINSGRDFHKRLYVQLKGQLLEMLSETEPLTSVEMRNRINQGDRQCNINQVVCAMSELEREGLAKFRGYRSKAQLWYKTTPEIRENIKRSDGTVKVTRWDSGCGTG